LLTRDYGLLKSRACPDGGHPRGFACDRSHGSTTAGIAAALACLMRDHTAHIVDAAWQVVDRAAEWAQWLIPCDAAGTPILSEIRSYVHERTTTSHNSNACGPIVNCIAFLHPSMKRQILASERQGEGASRSRSFWMRRGGRVTPFVPHSVRYTRSTEPSGDTLLTGASKAPETVNNIPNMLYW
jgi:hypothetical protein